MKKGMVVLFAWWFLAYNGAQPKQIGPFKDQGACEEIAAHHMKVGRSYSSTSVSKCWEGSYTQ